jgi:hypothetical protein
MSMQSGLGRSRPPAGSVGGHRRYGGAAVLLLGLAVAGCVNTGQLANLTETRSTTVAFESIDGPPPAVFHKFVKSLKDEASTRQIAVVPSGEASYRVRGYLAAHGADGATSIAWVLDVYDANERRAFRLSGEEKSAGQSWAAADDQVLGHIARNSMQQFVGFAADAGKPSTQVATAPPQRSSSVFGWIDDWTPEASGIFRLLRREPARPEITADAGSPLPPGEVPLPKSRPAAADSPNSTFAFAPEER